MGLRSTSMPFLASKHWSRCSRNSTRNAILILHYPWASFMCTVVFPTAVDISSGIPYQSSNNNIWQNKNSAQMCTLCKTDSTYRPNRLKVTSMDSYWWGEYALLLVDYHDGSLLFGHRRNATQRCSWNFRCKKIVCNNRGHSVRGRSLLQNQEPHSFCNHNQET